MIPGFFAAGMKEQGGGGSGWTPADLAVAPAIWLDWDSPVTDVSGLCSEWENSKGSVGGSFSQSVSSRRPAIIPAAVGGKRALAFDGGDDRLVANTPALRNIYRNTGAGWIFAVAARRSADTTHAHIMEVSAGSPSVTRVGMTAGSGAGSWLLAARRLDNQPAQILESSVEASDAEFHVGFSQVDYTNAAALITLDGQDPDTVTPFLTVGVTSNTESQRINIGANASDDSFGYVSIAAVLSGAGSLPSAAERARLEGWAAWQCGLQANLPIGHPYRNAPPMV